MVANDARLEFIKRFEGFPDQVIAMAFAYADCLTKYGVDVSAKWQTVTAQRDALNRAYIQGQTDEAARWSKREAEECEEQREYEAQVEAAQYCKMYEPSYDPETGAL